MNVLILGGNGYIGSKVTRELVNAGHSVVCTKRVSSSLSRLEDLGSKIKWIPASVDSVEASTQYTTFDYVLNMACNYEKNKTTYDIIIESNFVFPLKVFNTAVEHGTKRFLTIDTGLPEELNMYSFSKKMLSKFGEFYADKLGITFNNLQLEMFYGADEPEDRFLPLLIRKMLAGDIIETTIGTQHRDLIRAEDTVRAITMVVNSDLKGFHKIPVGTGETPTISEIIDYIWILTGKKSELRKGAIPMRPNEPDCSADISFLNTLGEWAPVGWKDGIKAMIEKMEGK